MNYIFNRSQWWETYMKHKRILKLIFNVVWNAFTSPNNAWAWRLLLNNSNYNTSSSLTQSREFRWNVHIVLDNLSTKMSWNVEFFQYLTFLLLITLLFSFRSIGVSIENSVVNVCSLSFMDIWLWLIIYYCCVNVL